MKYTIIFLVVLYSLNLHSIESDLLSITIQKSDSIQYFIYLDIENISNDTILLFTKFPHELANQPVGIGIRFTFYNRNSSFFPPMGDYRTLEYVYFGGRKYIYPNESIKLPIDLSEYFFRKGGDVTEHSIEIEIAYKYIILSSDPQKRKVRLCYFISDRIRVD